jgi:hypothetical protein
VENGLLTEQLGVLLTEMVGLEGGLEIGLSSDEDYSIYQIASVIP